MLHLSKPTNNHNNPSLNHSKPTYNPSISQNHFNLPLVPRLVIAERSEATQSPEVLERIEDISAEESSKVVLEDVGRILAEAACRRHRILPQVR